MDLSVSETSVDTIAVHLLQSFLVRKRFPIQTKELLNESMVETSLRSHLNISVLMS